MVLRRSFQMSRLVISVSYNMVSFTSQCAQLFASLQNCTYIVLNDFFLIHKFTVLVYCNTSAWMTTMSFLLQPHRLNDHHLHSAADRDLLLLSSNTASGWPIAPAVPSNSKKHRLLHFMPTQPQRTEAPKTNNLMFPEIISVWWIAVQSD